MARHTKTVDLDTRSGLLHLYKNKSYKYDYLQKAFRHILQKV